MDDRWERFWDSGRVEDYLNYRKDRLQAVNLSGMDQENQVEPVREPFNEKTVQEEKIRFF